VKPVYSRIAVVGLGLLGGSLAWAARTRGAAREVIGATRSADARARALRNGAVDAVASPEEAAQGAELVVLATPISAMPAVLKRMAPSLSEGCVVSDVGSVKGPLAEVLPGMLPSGVRYVGSHPMAGSHERGMDAATPDLFDGAVCIVCAKPADADAERLAAFWSALGARVVRREPERHDAEVAWMSHVPHAIAFAFASALAAAPAGAAEVAGPGFRDFTRIAQSDPELWADIFAANSKALAAPLQAARRSLDALAAAIEAGDADAVLRQLDAARRALCSAPPVAEVGGGSARSSEQGSAKGAGPQSSTGDSQAS
jgi:prephenate dehydrogenase